MSNSNHSSGRKLSFETRKTYRGRSLELHDTLSQFYTNFSQFRHISWITYSFKLQFILNRSQRAALNKQLGNMLPAGRQFDMPGVEGPKVASFKDGQEQLFELLNQKLISYQVGYNELSGTSYFFVITVIRYSHEHWRYIVLFGSKNCTI